MACMGSSRQPISRRCPESNKIARDCWSTHNRGITQAQTRTRTHTHPPPRHTHKRVQWSARGLDTPHPAVPCTDPPWMEPQDAWPDIHSCRTFTCSGSTPGRSWLRFSASAPERGPSHAALPRTAAPVISHVWSRQGPPRSARGNMGPTSTDVVALVLAAAAPEEVCFREPSGICLPHGLRDD